jgi:signal transduction histidine kinase
MSLSQQTKLHIFWAIVFVSGVFITFVWLHFSHLVSRAKIDFEKNNYIELQSGDGLSIAAKLESISTDGTYACIKAYKADVLFFNKDDGYCKFYWLLPTVQISGLSASSPITISMTMTIAAYFLVFLITVYLILCGAIILYLVTVDRISRERMLVYTEAFDLSRRFAHDIRSPLSAIAIVGSLLKRDDDKRWELLSGATERLNRITDSILGRFKSYENMVSGKAEAVRTMTFLELAHEIKQILIEKKDALSNILPHCPSFLTNQQFDQRYTGDKTEFGRLFSNLLQNAIEACRSNDRVYIEINEVKPGIEIVIRDTGPGIPPKILKRLGNEVLTEGKAAGNGLGLYFARKILETWNGDLRLESKVGFGTTVTARLKMAK